MRLLRIEEIVAQDEYWDLEVEDNHNFYINDILVHNSNASICYNGENLWAQSKENIITVEKDNAGFAFFVETNKEYFTGKLAELREALGVEEVCIYGEWAGKGIQKGVAVTEIPKHFFMFSIKYKLEEDYEWVEFPEASLELILDSERNIRSIYEFETYEMEIDFNKPELFNNKLIAITESVDKECPVGKVFGVSGHGEGVVWVGWFKNTAQTFKVKGESHSKSKVKTLKPVDDEKEQMKINIAQKVTPAYRLSQMYNETFDVLNGGRGDIKRTGDFLKAVNKDILKEEIDVITEAGLEPKEIFGYIAKISKEWFQEQLNRELGI